MRIGIDPNLHVLAGAHVDELTFLEVRGDPDFWRHDGNDLLAGSDVIACFDVALRHPAVLWRSDYRPGQIQMRLIEPGLCLLDLSLELADGCVRLADAFRHRRVLCYLRFRLLQRGLRRIDILLRGRSLRQRFLTIVVGFGSGPRRLSLFELGLGYV